MLRSVRHALLAVAVLLMFPVAVRAQTQASIAGVVRDTSGAVLPGVTVEAASPALIEKVRVVVTDDSGQYRIEALRPGVHTVTFTLPGCDVPAADRDLDPALREVQRAVRLLRNGHTEARRNGDATRVIAPRSIHEPAEGTRDASVRLRAFVPPCYS